MAAALAVGTAGYAQNLASGYFDSNYMYRFQSNPALAGNGTFVSVPGAGNVSAGLQGNIGLSHLLYNVDGKTTTFLNPGVSADQVLGSMPDKGKFCLNSRATILAIGAKSGTSYTTFSVSARANASVGVPIDLFRMAKQGIENTTYDLSQLGASGTAWAEVSVGHSAAVNSNLRIGANFKFLVGLAHVATDIRTANIHLRDNEYVAEVDAEVNTCLDGFSYETSYDEKNRTTYVSGGKIDKVSRPGGYGAAVDLGASYKFNGLELSASVTDLGFINWTNHVVASTNGLKSVNTSEYTFSVDNDDEVTRFTDKLATLGQLSNMGNRGRMRQMLNATMNLAANYAMPFYERLSIGLLYTEYFDRRFGSDELRLIATLRPGKCFSVSGSAATGTYGTRFGGLVTLGLPGLKVFVGSDCIPHRLAKAPLSLPLNSNASINAGVNFAF